jgi:ribosomal protein S18 acetylase RimI-like enzyme
MINLRNFRPGDLDTICRFKRESFRVNFPSSAFDESAFRKRILNCAKLQPDMIKVLEYEGQVAGYVCMKAVETTSGKFGRIVHIFVDEKHRRKGLGIMLMRAAEGELKAMGVKKVKLAVTKENEPAVSLYKGMGFKVTRYVMEKDL